MGFSFEFGGMIGIAIGCAVIWLLNKLGVI